jgi:hypothetical protein
LRSMTATVVVATTLIVYTTHVVHK